MSEYRPDPASRESAVQRVLVGVRALNDALDRMHSGVKDDMGMNATDLATLRMLIIREQQGQPVSPHDIARHLRISTASTTKLLDRLAAAGDLERRPHPHDRRARVIALLPASRTAFFAHYRESLGAMRDVAGTYSDADLDVVARFLDGLADAVAANDG